MHNGHEWVDLGLRSGGNKILFAKTNIGASSETDYGDYFAWGETSVRYTEIDEFEAVSGNPFDDQFAPYGNNMGEYTKYNIADGLTTLESSDDVASIMWGGSWRMPDISDLQYLFEGSVDYEWVSDYNGSGINGFKVIGKGEFASITLFLPATGNCCDSERQSAGNQGCYWSRSVDDGDPMYALGFCFDDCSNYYDCCSRYLGQSVRPVLVIPE